MSETVLVTGAAGFIGSNMVDALLEAGYKVIGVDDLSVGTLANLSQASADPAFDFHEIDVTKLEDLAPVGRNTDIILHLAAHKIPKYGDARKTLLTNTKGTENVLEIAREHNTKVVFTSTSDVYGKNREQPLREDGDLVLGPTRIPRWSYAASKIYDEHLIFAYRDAYKIPAVILRIFNSYGPRNSLTWRAGPQALFIDAALRNRSVEIHGDGNQTRCFTYISDTVAGIKLALENPKAVGQVFNIGNDSTAISIKDLAYLIKRLSGTPGELEAKMVPHDEAFGPYEEIMTRTPDISKAREVLGYIPVVGLEEGLSRTIDWQRPLSETKS